jgi:hypothetical protein
MSLHNQLESQLHELFVSQGQISSPSDIADLVNDFESSNGVALSDAEIIKATRNASESFIDSMVANEWDTEKEGYTDIEPLADRVAQWEAMRPSMVRIKQIKECLESGTVRVIYTHPGKSSYHDGLEWIKSLPTGFWLAPGQAVAVISP